MPADRAPCDGTTWYVNYQKVNERGDIMFVGSASFDTPTDAREYIDHGLTHEHQVVSVTKVVRSNVSEEFGVG